MPTMVAALGKVSSRDRVVAVELAADRGRQFVRIRTARRGDRGWRPGRDLALQLGEVAGVVDALLRSIEGSAARPEKAAAVEGLRRRLAEHEASMGRVDWRARTNG